MLNRLSVSPSLSLAQNAAEADGLDIRDVVNFLWRQWRFIVGVTAFATLIGAIYVARQTPIYTANAQLLLDPRKEKAAGQDTIISDIALDASAIESQLAVMRSSALLRRVVIKERLVNDPEFGATPNNGSSGILASIQAFFSRSAETDAKPQSRSSQVVSGLDTLSPETIATIENLKGAIGVARVGQAYVINVSFASADPAKAARLANAVADAYVVDTLDARYEAAKRASAWLSDRLVELRKQLHDSEEAVANFRAANNLMQGSAGGTLDQDQLSQLNGRLVAARSETAEKKARLDVLERVETGGGGVNSLPDLTNSGAIADLRKQENDLSRQEADLLARYSDRHPAVVNLRAQLSDVRRAIANEAKRMADSVKNEYELAKARQDAVEKTLRDATGQTDLDNAKAITLRELERTAAVNKSLFEDFLQRARVTQEQSTFEARDSRVITPALPPSAPSSPRTLLIVSGSMLVGLIAGVGSGYLLELLNAGFTTPRQIEDMLQIPLLASISKIESRDLSSDGGVLTIPQYPYVKPLSRFSEAVRSLRSAIQMSDVDNPPKVILVTSAVPSEGKTTIGLTIASSAAQSGLKVLMMDCDLRHSSISRYFKADENVGLVDYLMGGEELGNVIRADKTLGLWHLSAGGKTQNPPDLLGSDKMKALIGVVGSKFDLVVIDSPPMGPVVDPLILSGLVDKVVFVVRWAATAREMVGHSIERLSGHKKVAGVVFNHVIDAQAQKYGKYAYFYYYGGRYYKKYYDE